MWSHSRRGRSTPHKTPEYILRERAEAKVYNERLLDHETVILTNDATPHHLENGCMVLSIHHINFRVFTKAINLNTKIQFLTIKPDTIEAQAYGYFMQFGLAYNKSITHFDASYNQLGILMHPGSRADYNSFTANDLQHNHTLQSVSLKNTVFNNQAAHIYKHIAEINSCLIQIETGTESDPVNAQYLANMQLAVGKNIFKKFQEDYKVTSQIAASAELPFNIAGLIGEYLDKISIPTIKQTFPAQFHALQRYIRDHKLQLKLPKDNTPSIPELVSALKLTANQQRYFSEQRSMLKKYLKFFKEVQKFIVINKPLNAVAESSVATTHFSFFKHKTTKSPAREETRIKKPL